MATSISRVNNVSHGSTNGEPSRPLEDIGRDLIRAFRREGFLPAWAQHFGDTVKRPETVNGWQQQQTGYIPYKPATWHEAAAPMMPAQEMQPSVQQNVTFVVLDDDEEESKGAEDDPIITDAETETETVQVPQEDTVEGSNEERAKKQDRNFCNQDLLLVPGRACFNNPHCTRNHAPWPTTGELIVPGCMSLCEVCGKFMRGSAGQLRGHVQRKHVGLTHNPSASPETCVLWTSVRAETSGERTLAVLNSRNAVRGGTPNTNMKRKRVSDGSEGMEEGDGEGVTVKKGGLLSKAEKLEKRRHTYDWQLEVESEAKEVVEAARVAKGLDAVGGKRQRKR